jgi:hypothetical protein
MGLKTQTILVRHAFLDGGPDKLLADLGYEMRRKIRDVPFSHSGAGSIWIGAIGDCIVIYRQILARHDPKRFALDRLASTQAHYRNIGRAPNCLLNAEMPGMVRVEV